MKLIIKPKDNYSELFINYLKDDYIVSLLKNYYNHTRASRMSSEIGVDVLDILLYAVKNMSISTSGNSWIIETNKNLRYKNFNIDKLINFITYGNMKVKGYKLLYIILEDTANNLDRIYEEWLNGG